MKKILFVFLFQLCFMENTFSQTTIPGGVVSGIWTKANSPYLVQGAVMIANGTTLTIQPGTKVEFQGSYKFLVLGQLLAVGSAVDSIIFTSTNSTIGWLGIRFDSTAASNDTSRFTFCKFQYGRANGTSSIVDGGGLYFKFFSKVTIANSLITNCSANNWGGGIFCKSSNIKVLNSLFRNNTCTGGSGGGGIYFINSIPFISNNIFSGNSVSANGRGGGICCYNYGAPNGAIVTNNTFTNNTAFQGGGMFCSGGSVLITNNNFTNNNGASCSGIRSEFSNANIINNNFSNNNGTVILCESVTPAITSNTISNNNGKGILCFGNCSVSIINNEIKYNTSNGIYCQASAPLISNNKVTNNSSANGSAIYCYNSNPLISNNLIANNTATANGGAIYFYQSNPLVINNTISNNSASSGGAIFCTSTANPNLRNNILWGNTATNGNQIYLDDESSDPTITFSDIEGGSATIGVNSNVFYLGSYSNNINLNPGFVSATAGSGNTFNGSTANWSLLGSSSCINAGDPSGVYPTTDIAGNPRVFNSVIDLGAYEYQTPVGLNEHFIYNKTSIFPNPFSDQTTIKFNSLHNKNELTLYNAQGEFVKTFNNVSGDIFILKRENFAAGVYFLRITYANNVIEVKKLIVSN